MAGDMVFRLELFNEAREAGGDFRAERFDRLRDCNFAWLSARVMAIGPFANEI